MGVRKLFVFSLALILAIMLFCGCEGACTTESIAYVVGVAPEGYLETLTSLEDCD